MRFPNILKDTSKNTLITFTACIAVGFFIYYYASNSLLHSVETSLHEIAQQGAKIVQSDLRWHLDVLSTIAQTKEITDTKTGLQSKALYLGKIFKNSDFIWLTIADTHGNAYTSKGEHINIIDREHFSKVMKGQRAVSDPVSSKVNQKPIVIFAVPIYNGQQITGCLSAVYEAEELNKIIAKIRLGGYGNAIILNSKGKIIATNNRSLSRSDYNLFSDKDPETSSRKLAAIKRQMLQRKSGVGSYRYRGVENYIGFAPIEGAAWTIAVTAPRAKLFEGINQLLIFLCGSILAVIGIVVGMNIYLGRLQYKLQKERNIASNIIETANVLVIRYNESGEILDFNRYAEMKTGLAAKNVISKKKFWELIVKEDREQAVKITEQLLRGESPRNVELGLETEAGGRIYVIWNWNIIAHRHPHGSILEAMGIDITERVGTERILRENQEKLHYLAYHDSLTNLPNRLMLIKYWSELVEQRPNHLHALFFIDSDNFKLINDTLGHTLGDQLIQDIGARLCALVTEEQRVFRIGGDEFVICFSGFRDSDELNAIALLILDCFNEPFQLQDSRVNISVSIGVAIYPNHGTQAIDLLKNADIAMYRAKELGRNRFVIYDPEMQASINERMLIEKHLRTALQNQEFTLYYQPQIEICTGRIVGFEALLRWNSPELGMVSPLRFVKIAEDSGLIVKLGDWALRKACLFIKEIQQRINSELIIAVNISIIQLMQDNFVDKVLKTIDSCGLSPEYLEIEITESVLMESFDTINTKLELLRKQGIRLALDDFGKGYSSLNYLRQLPISTLKIDKSFIDNISDHVQGFTLTGDIVELGHKMGLYVIAEGVETNEQLEYLTKYRCDRFQGYIYSRPVPEKDVYLLFKKKIAYYGASKR